MPNSQAISDAFIDHHVGLQHYSNGVVEEVMRHLSDVEADVTNALLRGGDIRTLAKLKRQLAMIRDLQREGEATLRGIASERFSDAVIAEAEFLQDYYTKGQGLNQLFEYPSAATLVAAALSKPLANKHLKAWIRQLTNDQIKEIDRQVTTGVTLGESIPKIVNRIQGSIEAYGKDSVWARSKRSAEAFVRTGVAHVTNQGHRHFLENNPGVFSAWVHVSVLDNRTSRICEGLAGHVYNNEEDVQWPPLHPNCLPGDALVTTAQGITGASKRWFNGDLVIVRTATGLELACTPNHPVLTDRGWVPAQALDLGSRVVYDRFRHRPLGRPDGKGQNVPARVHDVAVAALGSHEVAARPVKCTPVYFHGDGAGSDVAIVGTNRQLRHGVRESSLVQLQKQAELKPGTGLSGLSALALLLEADGARSFVGLDGGRSPLFGIEAAIAGVHLLAPRPSFDASIFQDPLYGTWTDAEDLRDACYSQPGIEHLDNGGGAQVYASATDRDVASVHPVVSGARIDAEALCDGSRRLATSIALDDVVYVGRRDFHGHVYNLETADGLILADGIVTHNCRSTIVGVPKGTDPKALGFDTFGVWLKRQTPDYVEQILGPARAKLYREGKLNVDRFWNNKNKFLTIDELKARNKAAWKKAFPANDR